MMQMYFTGAEAEKKFGYCRALEVDGWIFVSGTGGIDPAVGKAPDDVEEQAKLMIESVSKTLEKAGSSLSDVVMRSIYLKDAKDTAAVWSIINERMNHSPANQGLAVDFLRPDLKVLMSVIARKGAGKSQ